MRGLLFAAADGSGPDVLNAILFLLLLFDHLEDGFGLHLLDLVILLLVNRIVVVVAVCTLN
jgi:hypothetical protein